MNKLENYITGNWITGDGEGQQLYNAVTGEAIAAASTSGLDFKQILEYGRMVGNPTLRKMTFHERGNMLKALAMYLRNHLDKFYMVGDLIDRGPHSRGVVDRMLGSADNFDAVVMLRGNHEQFLLDALVQPQTVWDGWLSHGGRQTLASYGIPERLAMTDPARLAEALRREIPARHLDLFEAMPLFWRCGDYFFAHAGVRPQVSLDHQSARDLLMIRGEFLESEADHGAVVVHGHSIREQVEVRSNRIGLDTGAYHTGILSAVRLDGAEREFLTVSVPVDADGSARTGDAQDETGPKEFLKQ